MKRDEWLKERDTGIGGSDAPAVLGVSQWRTPLQVYQEKRGEIAPQPENWAMRWGNAMEPQLREAYMEMTGREVAFHQHELMRHPQHEFMIATPDGWTDGRLVEIKTARTTDGWGEPGSDQIPQAYLVQVQHYMVVTALPVADVILGVYGNEPAIYEVPADRELQEMIIEAEAEFWRRVREGVPPEPRTVADMQSRFPRSVSKRVIAPAEIEGRCIALKELKAQLDQLETQADDCKAEIMKAMGDADELIGIKGETLATWRSAKPTMRFDAKAFQAAQPALYSSFLKAGESSRRFLLK